MATYMRNVRAGIWAVLASLAGAMCVVIPAGLAQISDGDGDGVRDAADNCIEDFNPTQIDVDGDGFGNACDPDYNNDGVVGTPDLDLLRAQFGKTSADPTFDPTLDLDGNGAIGISDFNSLRRFLDQAPGPSSATAPPVLLLDRPVHGEFVLPSGGECDVPAEGRVPNVADIDLELLLEGNPTTTGNGDFATSVLGPPVFVPVLAEATRLTTDETTRQQNVAHCGDSIPANGLALRSVGVRVNDSGLDKIEPAINLAVAGQLATIEQQILALSPIVVKDCVFLDVYDLCAIELDSITINSVSVAGVNLALDSTTSGVEVSGSAASLDLQYTANLDGIIGDCDGTISADSFDVVALLDLEPGSDRSLLDVQQVGTPTVSAIGLRNDFTSGICDFPILEDLIDLFVGNIGDFVLPAIENAFVDPDGAGPQDALIADVLGSALAGVSIGGAVGSELGLNLTALFAAIPEDNVGLSFEVDSNVTPTPPSPAPGAPTLPASYEIDATFPSFGVTAPGGASYDLGLAISQNLLNKLLRSDTEDGAFALDLTEFDFDAILPGLGVRPISTQYLAFVVPGFASVPVEDTVVRFRPTLAPVITLGSDTTNAVVDIAGMDITVVGLTSGTTFVRARLDGQFDLTPTLSNDALNFQLGAFNFTNIDLIASTVGATQVQIDGLNGLLGQLNPDAICQSLDSVALPSFAGFSLDPVVIQQDAGFLNLYTDLVFSP